MKLTNVRMPVRMSRLLLWARRPGDIDQLLHCASSVRYDTRCYFNVRSKADMSRLNLPHGDDN